MPKLTRFFSGTVFATVLLLGGSAFPAHATGLNSQQISSILGLLKSFGADQSVINRVSITLNRGSFTPSSYPDGCSSYSGFSSTTGNACNGQTTTPTTAAPTISSVQAYAQDANIITPEEKTNVIGSGFSPNSTVTVWVFHSDGLLVIGNYAVPGQVSANGSLVAFIVPNSPAGNYNVYVTDVAGTVFKTNSVNVTVSPPTTQPTNPNPSAQSMINVIYPTDGATPIQGRPITISWQSVGNPNANYTVAYGPGNGNSGTVIGTYSATQANCANADRCYISWTPTVVSPITFINIVDTVSGLSGSSESFVIAAQSTVSTSLVQTPSTPGITFVQGQPVTIAWQGIGGQQDVYTLSYNNGTPIKSFLGTEANCDSMMKCHISWTPTFSSSNVTLSIYDDTGLMYGTWGAIVVTPN